MSQQTLAKLCESFIYETAICTSHFMLNLPTRHCLFSTIDFSRQLLKESEDIKVIEWAQREGDVVKDGKINIRISRCGHILTAIFVPVFSSLCIRIQKNKPSYFFDPDFTDGGSKFSLYFPISLCHGTPEAIIEVPQRYEGTFIPLTFFYSILSESFDEEYTLLSLQKTLLNHLQQRFHDLQAKSLPEKISFVMKGRFIVDEYERYIYNSQIRKVSLGNFELITLYSKEPEKLVRLLKKQIPDFHLLDDN